METGLYYGIYIPAKSNFEGSVELCAGSIAAINYKPLTPSELLHSADSDPEYPTDSPHWLIFLDKVKALDVLKQFKEARLREFPNLEQTERYVQFGFESVQSLKLCGKVKKLTSGSATATVTASASASTQVAVNATSSSLMANCDPILSTLSNGEQQIKSGTDASNGCSPANATAGFVPSSGCSINSINSSSSNNNCPGSIVNFAATSGERPPFRAPTKQELVEFRKTIENGDFNRVYQYVWENPRYLISCGDTPTNLKEGYRYNALHICAQFNQAKIAEMLLHIVSNRQFADLYTGKRANPDMCAALNESLLDYYLNIPDKGRSETPLHFAVKNGHVQVVAVLVSFPQCKTLRNKDGQLPHDIICMRARNPDPQLHKQIETLLTERFYVPVLRAADLTLPPQIGPPFSCKHPPEPNKNSHRLSPNYKVKALAGPMNKDQAQKFCRRWKTPPRVTTPSTASPSSLTRGPFMSPIKPANLGINHTWKKTPIPMMMAPHRRCSLFAAKTPLTEVNQAQQEQTKSDAATETDSSIDKRMIELNSDEDNNGAIVTVEVDSVAITANGLVDYALVDTQNGNHKKQLKTESPMQQSEEMLSASMIGAQDDGLFNVTADFETNNNQNINNNIIADTSGSSISSLGQYEKSGTILFPGSPLKHLPRHVAMAFREIESSPLINELSWNVPSSPGCRTPTSQQTSDESLTALNESFKERHIKNSDYDKGVEVIGRQLAKQENVLWTEYWDFLGEFVDIALTSGLEKFENYLQQHSTSNDVVCSPPTNHTNMFEVCNALNKLCVGTRGDVAGAAVVDGGAGGDGVFKLARQHELEDLRSVATATGTGSVPTTTATSSTFIPSSLSSLTSAATTVTTIPQVNTPYTCVEKSLQVFAKRITKTIVNNIGNVGSINDMLVSELKRLKSLICSFKEDSRFYSVDFTKVHSRIGNLVAIYIEHSQEVMLATKLKIQSILRDLPFTHCERREHLECVYAHMLLMLEKSSDELPDLLKTEELCSSAWNREQSCYCHWDGHLSRKTSRRKRAEALSVQQTAAKLNAAGESKDMDADLGLGLALLTESAYNSSVAAAGLTKPVSSANINNNDNDNHYNVVDNVAGNDVADSANDEIIDEEIFWSNCASDFSDDDEQHLDESFYTPPESNSPLHMLDETYKIFIFGEEPTKCDLDVLNAIFHVDIDKAKYPRIYAWKEALLRYSNDEMDLFPSPKPLISTTHKLVISSPIQNLSLSSGHELQQRDEEAPSPVASVENIKIREVEPIVTHQTFFAKIAGKGKRLLATPKLNAVLPQTQQQTAATGNAVYKTPVHKPRGLFSHNRDTGSGSNDTLNEEEATMLSNSDY